MKDPLLINASYPKTYSLRQVRLTKWSFFEHITTRNAHYVHPRLDSILELCRPTFQIVLSMTSLSKIWACNETSMARGAYKSEDPSPHPRISGMGHVFSLNNLYMNIT